MVSQSLQICDGRKEPKKLTCKTDLEKITRHYIVR